MSFRRFAGAAALAGAVAFAGALPGQAATLDDPDAHMVFPEIISKEPLGPLVRHGDDQWAVRAIAAEGNYAEIFERNLGVGSPLGLPRSLGALYRDGGILYSAPFR